MHLCIFEGNECYLGQLGLDLSDLRVLTTSFARLSILRSIEMKRTLFEDVECKLCTFVSFVGF